VLFAQCHYLPVASLLDRFGTFINALLYALLICAHGKTAKSLYLCLHGHHDVTILSVLLQVVGQHGSLLLNLMSRGALRRDRSFYLIL
jgi:hypothetical protein